MLNTSFNRICARRQDAFTRSGIGRTSAVVIIVIVLVVAGVGAYLLTRGPSIPSSVSSTTGTSTTSLPSQLTIDEFDPFISVDPGVTIDLAGEEIVANTNLPLIFFDCNCPRYDGYMPVLANSWQRSSDGLTYTFNLRSGIHFSNGNPLNAYVVWYNVYRNMFMNQALDSVYFVYANTTGVTVDDLNSFNNPSNQPNAALLQVMQNPHNSVTVLNETAFEFHLTTPFVGLLPQIAAGPPWNFADPYTVEQHGGVVADQPNAWMAANGTTVSDGPYVMQSYVPDQYVILVANPDYWAQDLTSSERNFMLQAPNIATIVINYKADELTRALDLNNNRAQASVLLYSDIDSVLAGDKNVYIPHTGNTGTLEWLALNTFKFPFNNRLVRQAVVESINVTEIQQLVYHGYIAPLNGPVLHGYFGYDSSIQAPPYNVTDAKRLLAEAGYPNGQGLPQITYIYFNSQAQSVLSEILVNDLSQIGITVVPEGLSSSAAISLFGLPPTDPKAPLILQETWTYWPDFTAYEFVIDADLGVFFDFNNATINDLIYQSNVEQDPTARGHMLSQIVQMTNEQAGFVWLGQDIDTFATGVGNGPIAWNNCLTGMFENTGFIGIDFAAISYTCNPS